eukprot:TRINITY_DN2231_c0_g1_i1.p1 TRINITY_DN2231_c0_g1~~TRINITY_DN2231_c0_g1_i1.p1  ORF type:complete len:111 (+),score=31.58 TRINITY_DN2231_c0_g1_i1:958-1290(+)
MQPHLMEVNFSPSLGCDCDVDDQVKLPMLHSLLDTLERLDRIPRWQDRHDTNNAGACFECVFPFDDTAPPLATPQALKLTSLAATPRTPHNDSASEVRAIVNAVKRYLHP